MKVHKYTTGAIEIYPFLKPDADLFAEAGASCVMVRPGGEIKLIWLDAPIMDLEAAKALAEAINKAVEIAQGPA